ALVVAFAGPSADGAAAIAGVTAGGACVAVAARFVAGLPTPTRDEVARGVTTSDVGAAAVTGDRATVAPSVASDDATAAAVGALGAAGARSGAGGASGSSAALAGASGAAARRADPAGADGGVVVGAGAAGRAAVAGDHTRASSPVAIAHAV